MTEPTTTKIQEGSKYYFPKMNDKRMFEPLDAEKLSRLTVLEKKQLAINYEQHQAHLEWKKDHHLLAAKFKNTEVDTQWIGRINYRISICKKQKSIIEKYLGIQRAQSYERAYVDIAKTILDEEDHNRIHARAIALAEITREESKKSYEGEVAYG